MGTGTLALQVSFVYTHHLYYYRFIQHMIVQWVTQENTNLQQPTQLNVGTVQANTERYELRPPVSNAKY